MNDLKHVLNVELKKMNINSLFDILPDNVIDTIHKYRHQMEFKDVMEEIHDVVDYWCIDQLAFRYCKARHEPMYQKFVNEFKCLNDCEEHLFVNLISTDILGIMNDN